MPLIVGPDPNYYQEQSERWGNALNAMTQILAQKREREDRELQRNLELMARNPELSLTLGDDLVRKYGRKRPELVSLVGTLQNEQKLKQQSIDNFNKFGRAYSQEVGARDAFAKSVEAMPDQITYQQTVDSAGTTIPVPFPNVAKQAARSQIALLPSPEWSAFQKMNPEDRYAAYVSMIQNNIDPPKPPETMGPKDLSQGLRDLLAAGIDMNDPIFYRGALSSAGEREPPAAEAKRGAETKIEQEKNAREQDEKLAEEQRRREEWDRQHGLNVAEAKRKEGVIAARQGGPKTDKDSQKRLDAEIDDALASRTAGSPQRKAEKKAHDRASQSAKRRGTETPADLPEALPSLAVKNQIKDEIKRAVTELGLSSDDASGKVMGVYDQVRARGGSVTDALKQIREFLDVAIKIK